MTAKKTGTGKNKKDKSTKTSGVGEKKSQKKKVSTQHKEVPVNKIEVETVQSQPVLKGGTIKPDLEEAVRLVMQVMNHFIDAKQAKTMLDFMPTIAKKWQDITTVEKLNTSFAAIINDPTDWSFLKTVQPSLIKEGLSERGDWVVVGVYPTKPKRLIFEQIFIDENNSWKLAELKLFVSD